MTNGIAMRSTLLYLTLIFLSLINVSAYTMWAITSNKPLPKTSTTYSDIQKYDAPSSLQQFICKAQQAAIEEKKYEYDQYKLGLQLDGGKPGRYCAQWYRDHRLEQEIATQDFFTAASLFNNHSIEGQHAVKQSAETELQQTMLHLLSLPTEYQEHILLEQFPGIHTTKALHKFYELPLHVACKNLGWAKQYAKRTDDAIDVSTWFLLDTPEQRHEALQLWKKRNHNHKINSTQQLAVIRSLPPEIKTHIQLQQLSCERNLTFKEHMTDITQHKEFPTVLSYGMLVIAGTTIIFGGGSFVKDRQFNQPFGTNLLGGLAVGFCVGSGLCTGLGSLAALLPLYGLKTTAGISGSILCASYYYTNYNPNSIIKSMVWATTLMHGFMSSSTCASVTAVMDKEPPTHTITKPLNEI